MRSLKKRLLKKGRTKNALKDFLQRRRKKVYSTIKKKKALNITRRRARTIKLLETSYIGIGDKEKKEVQERMTQLALIDAKHDFQELAEKYKNDLINYLPRKINIDTIDEQEKGFETITKIPLFKTLSKSINNIIKHSIHKRDYNIYGKNISELENGYDILDMLRKCSHSETNEFTFFIDTYAHHLLDKIKTPSTSETQMNKYKEPHVYLAYNREAMCDSGIKTTKKTRPYLFNDISNTIKLTQLDDKEDGSITYTKFNSKDKNILNDFYSNFDIVIGEPDKLYYKMVYDNTEYITNINNKENSLNNCKERIINSDIEINKILPFFQKRSGDWLQGLSSLDKLRYYVPTSTKGIQIIVTIDQIFLAYALSIGANVLYCQAENPIQKLEKSFIFFYNNTVLNIINPLERFKIFFKISYRFPNAILGKDLLIEQYNKLNSKITEYIDLIISKMNIIENLYNEKNISMFNKLYITFHILLIKKIELFKQYKQFIEEPYKSLKVEAIDMKDIKKLHMLEQFVMNVEYYLEKYSLIYVNSELIKIDKIFSDYTKVVKIEKFVFLDFKNLFSEKHISFDTLYLEKASIKAYYKYLATEESTYLKQLLKTLSKPTLYNSRYINLFKELALFDYLDQEGGTLKSLNTLSLAEASEMSENRTVSIKTHNIDEDHIVSIKYLELILKDYTNYEKTNVINFYNNNKLSVSLDLSLHDYHFNKLQSYLENKKDKKIYSRFIDVILEVLYRNNIHTFNKSEVKKVFETMEEPKKTINKISIIKDFELQDSCLAVARQLYTEKTYISLMTNFPFNF